MQVTNHISDHTYSLCLFIFRVSQLFSNPRKSTLQPGQIVNNFGLSLYFEYFLSSVKSIPSRLYTTKSLNSLSTIFSKSLSNFKGFFAPTQVEEGDLPLEFSPSFFDKRENEGFIKEKEKKKGVSTGGMMLGYLLLCFYNPSTWCMECWS